MEQKIRKQIEQLRQYRAALMQQLAAARELPTKLAAADGAISALEGLLKEDAEEQKEATDE